MKRKLPKAVKKKRKPAKKQKRNQDWLATRLKISQQRVSKLMQREGWHWGKGGWTDAEAEEIGVWRTTLREDNNATADAMIGDAVGGDVLNDGGDAEEVVDPNELLKLIKSPAKRLQLMGVIERSATSKVKRELLLQGYLKKEDVEDGRAARVRAVRQELSIIRLLALKLDGKSVIEMESILEEWARSVCDKFERGDVGN